MEKVKKCAFGELDNTNYPLIKYTISSIEPTVEDIKEFMRILQGLIGSNEGGFIVIYDGTNAKWLDSSARVEIGAGIKQTKEKYKGRYKKAHIVAPNVLIHMLLKGINIVAKPEVPQVICKSAAEAIKLAEEEIKHIKRLEVPVA